MASLVLTAATLGGTTAITPTDQSGTITCTLPSTGGTLQTSGAGFTTNGVAYASSTSALTTGSALVFTGTNLGIGTSSPADKLDVSGNARVGQGQITADATVGTLGIYGGVTASSANAQLQFYGKSVSNTGATYELARISGASYSTGGSYSIDGGLQFSTSSNNGANVLTLSERMRITSTGNVGIGTTAPQSHLSVLAIGSTVGLTSDAALRIQPSGTGSTDQIVFGYSESGGYSNGVIGYINTSSVGYQKGDIFFATRSATSNTAPTERMRIDSDGYLMVGQTSQIANGKLNVNFVGGSGSYRGISLYSNSTAGTAMLCCTNANGIVGEIISTGSSTAYNTSSDYRLKNTIAPMTGALAKVSQLKPVTYKWNADGSDSQGFIAHELQEIVPECVTGEKDGVDEDGKPVYQGIDTSFLVATLTSALQELSTLITAQQSTIQSLTERITALEGART